MLCKKDMSAYEEELALEYVYIDAVRALRNKVLWQDFENTMLIKHHYEEELCLRLRNLHIGPTCSPITRLEFHESRRTDSKEDSLVPFPWLRALGGPMIAASASLVYFFGRV